MLTGLSVPEEGKLALRAQIYDDIISPGSRAGQFEEQKSSNHLTQKLRPMNLWSLFAKKKYPLFPNHHVVQLLHCRPFTPSELECPNPTPWVWRLPFPYESMRTVLLECSEGGISTHRHGSVVRERERGRRGDSKLRYSPQQDLRHHQNPQSRRFARSYV